MDRSVRSQSIVISSDSPAAPSPACSAPSAQGSTSPCPLPTVPSLLSLLHGAAPLLYRRALPPSPCWCRGCLIGAVGRARAIPSAPTCPRNSPTPVAEISIPPLPPLPLPSLHCLSHLAQAQTLAAASICSALPSASSAFPRQNIEICELRNFLLLPFLSPTLCCSDF